MLTAAEVDKDLNDMTDGELSAIVAECRHTLRSRRYTNSSHYRYLMNRLNQALSERDGRSLRP